MINELCMRDVIFSHAGKNPMQNRMHLCVFRKCKHVQMYGRNFPMGVFTRNSIYTSKEGVVGCILTRTKKLVTKYIKNKILEDKQYD